MVSIWLAPLESAPGLSRRSQERRVSRALLRAALTAENAAIIGDRIEIIERERGGPLVPEASRLGIRFSISHSQDQVAVATSSTHRALGVDIELGQCDREFERLAAGFCSDHERSVLSGLPDFESKRDRFYRLWTGKEAVFKSLDAEQQTVPFRRLVAVDATAAVQRQVMTGWLGDYCLSVATEAEFSLNLFGEEPGESLQHLRNRTMGVAK